MNFSIAAEIFRSERNNNRWQCSLFVNVAPFCSVDPEMVDLCTFLEDKNAGTHLPSSGPKNQCYKFPSHFNGPASRERLQNLICLAGVPSGFNIVVASSQKIRGSLTLSSTRLYSMLFACKRYRPYEKSRNVTKTFEGDQKMQSGVVPQSLHRSSKKKGKPLPQAVRKASTERALKAEECCPFSFTVFMTRDGAWYLSTKVRADRDTVRNHYGHERVLSEHVNPLSSRMPASEQKLNSDCASVHVGATDRSNVIAKQTASLNWLPSQCRYLSTKEKNLLENITGEASSADKLISSFKARYVYQ